nr:PREDICTED: uric acid degradation bifunctional protein TTL-like isoform X1 [Musa acuminata subsp. malaccensis]
MNLVRRRRRMTRGFRGSPGDRSRLSFRLPNDSALQELVEWNFRYREKFGFVFLICASGRGTTEILAELKVPSSKTTEISDNSHHTCPPSTTHVLDVARGSPASGMEVHLEMWKGTHQHPSFTNRESTHQMLIGSLITNTDGCSGPL